MYGSGLFNEACYDNRNNVDTSAIFYPCNGNYIYAQSEGALAPAMPTMPISVSMPTVRMTENVFPGLISCSNTCFGLSIVF